MVVLARTAAASKGSKAQVSYRSMDHFVVAKFKHLLGARKCHWPELAHAAQRMRSGNPKVEGVLLLVSTIEAHPITFV